MDAWGAKIWGDIQCFQLHRLPEQAAQHQIQVLITLIRYCSDNNMAECDRYIDTSYLEHNPGFTIKCVGSPKGLALMLLTGVACCTSSISLL